MGGTIFDREQLQHNHRGVEDLIPSTITEFLTYIPEMQKCLVSAFENDQKEDLTRAAHSLKGAVASVCSEPLRELAYKIEKLSKENSKSEILPLLSELENGLNQLTEDLQTYQKEISEDVE